MNTKNTLKNNIWAIGELYSLPLSAKSKEILKEDICTKQMIARLEGKVPLGLVASFDTIIKILTEQIHFIITRDFLRALGAGDKIKNFMIDRMVLYNTSAGMKYRIRIQDKYNIEIAIRELKKKDVIMIIELIGVY